MFPWSLGISPVGENPLIFNDFFLKDLVSVLFLFQEVISNLQVELSYWLLFNKMSREYQSYKVLYSSCTCIYLVFLFT